MRKIVVHPEDVITEVRPKDSLGKRTKIDTRLVDFVQFTFLWNEHGMASRITQARQSGGPH